MTCRRFPRRALALLALLGVSIAAQADDTRALIVDLFVNGEYMGEAFVLEDDAGNFYLDETALLHWQIRRPWPEPRQFGGNDFYGLQAFDGATANFDPRVLELRVSMPASLMPTRRLRMSGVDSAPDTAGRGAYIDYDINLLGRGIDAASPGALLRPVVFGPFGNVSANVAYRDTAGFGDSAERLSVLDLTYTRDDPDRMRSLRIGDVVTLPGQQRRALRIGGVQLASNFATRPTLITHPLPDFYGETAVPSAVDIYVNGRLSRRQEVEPGSFVLEDLPVINGLGQVQVLATDALGRRQVFVQDFYLATDLLAEGLTDYSLTLGALREDFGLQNFRYGDIAGAATWRHGVSDELTVEMHGEFTDHLVMSSGGLKYAVPVAGTLNAGIGVSDGSNGTGVSWQLGFQRLARPTNLNILLSGTTESFDVVGATQPDPKLQALVAVGQNLYTYGAVRASVIHQDLHDQTRRTIWGLDYSSRLFGRVSFAANVSFVDSDEDDLRIGLRFFTFFGRDHSASANVSAGRDGSGGNAVFQRSLPMHEGYGYHVGVGHDSGTYVDAGAAARNEHGTYFADIRSGGESDTVWQLGMRGSVAHMAGLTRFAREVNDAFAVVRVGEIEGVRVYSENIEVGRTDEKGRVFVPNIQPFVGNQLRIEIDDLPMNARIVDTERVTAPYARSGVLVDFDVRVTTNVVLRAVRPDGSPLPEGAVATVEHTGDQFPVGLDGKLYLQGIDRSSEVSIRFAGRTCDLDVPYPSSNAVIAKMGDRVCRPLKVQ